ncbi:hypothetical protein [Sandaracinus amylolyticus]|uniref:Uncharacterized protein n=1 Tax=Sandaracinus amylolyticus TaxID=927083 RepID=A0A0F6SI66_9BACT|nr:hypothetical protein [Sandaracinus amylolyticus]AKF11659.1 hypothetical protein DB32_008808 [Sandaracinus amylolyticus]
MTQRRQGKSERGSAWGRLRAILPNLARLFAFLLVVYAVAMVIVARQVRAETNEIMLGVGSQMMTYAEADAQDSPRTLHVNGQRLLFGSGHTANHDVDEVLDFFEARCTSRDGRLVERVHELYEQRQMPVPDTSMLDGTLRDSTERSGYVACFDVGEEREGVEGLLARLQSFADSGNLARMGGLRYVYARRTDDGGTHFLVFHTDEELNVYEMFPSTGDAPGADVDGLPRPANTRRLMSAWEEGDPHSLSMYTSTTRSAEELQRWYRSELPDSGWDLVEPTDAQRDRFTRHWSQHDRDVLERGRALHAEQGDRQVMVVFTDDEPSGQAVVTVLTAR